MVDFDENRANSIKSIAIEKYATVKQLTLVS